MDSHVNGAKNFAHFLILNIQSIHNLSLNCTEN